jgi:hypothetical protein
VAKRFESGEGLTIAGLLQKTVGPLCVVRKAQIELGALKETDLNSKARRQRLSGSRCFMRPYCIALGDTEKDAWLIMEHLELVRVSCSALSALKRTPQDLFDRLSASHPGHTPPTAAEKMTWSLQLLQAALFILSHPLAWGDVKDTNIMLK